MGLRLPGGEATAAGLLEGLVCLSPPAWFGAALQTALAARGAPDGQDAVLRMLQRLPVSSLPAPVAVEAMSQVSGWPRPMPERLATAYALSAPCHLVYCQQPVTARKQLSHSSMPFIPPRRV